MNIMNLDDLLFHFWNETYCITGFFFFNFIYIFVYLSLFVYLFLFVFVFFVFFCFFFFFAAAAKDYEVVSQRDVMKSSS